MTSLLRTLLLFLLCWTAAVQARDTLPQPVAQALSRAGVPASSTALVVQEVDAKSPQLGVNAQVPMNPASVMKLLTTYAALDLLGPAYTWKTEAYLSAPLKGDVLEGDLLLKGYGDPKLGIEDFWLFLHDLRARGLREIRGDLVLDRSWFDVPSHDPALFDKEPLRPYNVGADALLLNYKSVRFRLIPDVQNKSVQLTAEPPLAKMEVENRLSLSNGPCPEGWRHNLNLLVSEDGEIARLKFSGNFPLSCGEKVWNIALLSHPQYVLATFRSMWKEMGGTFAGGVREGLAPPGALPFATQESPAASELLRDMNKFSNNTMARQIFLTLSAQIMEPPGRYDKSAQLVKDWLKQRDLDMPELVIDNGAGLSRDERISAANMQRILIAAWRSAVMPEFVSSMPLVGRDGTARRRLKSDPVTGQAHIKTGTLSGVRSMAGYVLNRKGKRLAFTFIVNHPNAEATQDAQDALLRWLYDN